MSIWGQLGIMAMDKIFALVRPVRSAKLLCIALCVTFHVEAWYYLKIGIPENSYRLQRLSSNEEYVLLTVDLPDLSRMRLVSNRHTHWLRQVRIPVDTRALEFNNGFLVTIEKPIDSFVFSGIDFSAISDKTNGSPAALQFQVSTDALDAPMSRFCVTDRGLPIPLLDGTRAVMFDDYKISLVSAMGYGTENRASNATQRQHQGSTTRCVSASQVHFGKPDYFVAYCGAQEFLGAGDRGSRSEVYKFSHNTISFSNKWETCPSFAAPQQHIRGDFAYHIDTYGKNLVIRHLPNGNVIKEVRLPYVFDCSNEVSPYRFWNGDVLWFDGANGISKAFDISTMNEIPSIFQLKDGTSLPLLYWNTQRSEAWYGEQGKLICADPLKSTTIMELTIPFPPGDVQYASSGIQVLIHSEDRDLRWMEVNLGEDQTSQVIDGLGWRRLTFINRNVRIASITLTIAAILLWLRTLRRPFDAMFARSLPYSPDEK